MVGDDVEIDLDAASVRVGDERLEFGVGAQVWIDPGEVGDPVAVVTGRGVGPLALHRVVHERGGEPEGGGAEALNVVEGGAEAREVAAVVEALVGRVEAGDHRVGAEAGGVVARVAVLEPVGHHEVELLVATGLADGLRRQRSISF